MKKYNVLKSFSFIFVLLSIVSFSVGIITINSETDDIKSITIMEASSSIEFNKEPMLEGVTNIIEASKEVKIEIPKKEVKNETKKAPTTVVHIKIPTYNQAVTGYILGCEGVSLFMALKGLGYIPDTNINDFMKTMPQGDTPFTGYMGNPKIGHTGENTGKRTTIYPEPLANWASEYATGKDLTGATIDDLYKELDQGHVILAFVTSGWAKPVWKHYSWSKTDKGEVENNHCLTIVGYRSNGDFLVNDCHDGRRDGRQGEYWISATKFAEIYNARHYAVSVY